MVGAFVLLDIILLSLWTGIEPMHTGYQQFDDKVWLINWKKQTNKQANKQAKEHKK